MAAFILNRYWERRIMPRNRILRDRIHPLEKYNDLELYKKLRFRRQGILHLTDEVSDEIQLAYRMGALPPVSQVRATRIGFLRVRFVSRRLRGTDWSEPAYSK
ncbi:hypothetical protein V1264_016873 [Littorina saxatilis]|uniref:Uncharacterized protein n=1 Tax=Littorina saxatilis TaxID=31220 RepID=A0AAN9BHG2_9CAEN